MSKKLLSFFVDELQIIRVTCKSAACGATIEMPIESAERLMPEDCPICKKPLTNGGPSIADLAKMVRKIAAAKDELKVEFVLPDQGQ